MDFNVFGDVYNKDIIISLPMSSIKKGETIYYYKQLYQYNCNGTRKELPWYFGYVCSEKEAQLNWPKMMKLLNLHFENKEKHGFIPLTYFLFQNWGFHIKAIYFGDICALDKSLEDLIIDTIGYYYINTEPVVGTIKIWCSNNGIEYRFLKKK